MLPNLKSIAEEIEQEFERDMNLWYPRTLDPRGGFHTAFGRDWNLIPYETKGIVHQSRMIWTASEVVRHRPTWSEKLLPLIQHGTKFLREKMWDEKCGGFFWEIKENGTPIEENAFMKHAYGMAFAIYGLAAAYRVTQNKADLDFARETFFWLDRHAHDLRYGGYFEEYYRDGRLMTEPPKESPEIVQGKVREPLGCKSMNSHIHLLEAFTVLYEIWHDETLRSRLEELLFLVTERIITWPGAMRQFFKADWTPAATYVSFGHDVETAYLLAEAAAALGRPNDEPLRRIGKSLVDHSLRYGWDEKHGGFCYDGATFAKPAVLSKFWWVQAEGLNSLLLMHDQFGSEEINYCHYFAEQWNFIRNYIIDTEYGGWYAVTEADGSNPQGLSKILNVQPAGLEKSHLWKAAYHEVRALLNTARKLEKICDL
ncbi:MAG: AGE family epimerase/isomerase [Planctomycetaceae bacterium]|nr:AGE family epimerase/isomerase [Planctomycetaceae bacterium]